MHTLYIPQDIIHFPFSSEGGAYCFSTSAITSSKALSTFSLSRAEASVHAQFHASANSLPSSGCTCLPRISPGRIGAAGTSAGVNQIYFQRDIWEPTPFPTLLGAEAWRSEFYGMVENFISNDFNHFQGLPSSYRIHEQVSMYSDRMS